MLGAKCVGKSNIILQFISNKFDQYYIITIFKEDFRKRITIGSNNYSMYLTITSVDQQYQGDYSSINKFVDFFIVFDISNHDSFIKVKEFSSNDIIQYIGLVEDDYSNVLLVRNKCDIKNRKVSTQEISEFCNKK